MQLNSAFQDPHLCRALLQRLETALNGRSMRFMEVCGTHTVAIFQSGLRSLLPASVTHLSGPGCPVCVTHDAEVAAFLDLAGRDKVIVATFGDLLRVPGPDGRSLKHAQAQGARVEIVYSALDALALARNNPGDLVVFLGIGFETTAPTVAATLLTARQKKIENFCVLSLHKLVPPALRALLDDASCAVEAFLLPGHVSTVLGLAPYAFLADEYHMPGVVGGFEPADILLALCIMAEQLRDRAPAVINAYPRAVSDTGNARARALMEQFFTPSDALWRGLGRIPRSGLALRPEYADLDALIRLDLRLPETRPLPGCRCGQVLKGQLRPPQCPLFGKKCTPATPVGPCMVSTEGSCAAYFKYGEH
ncbi:hydrogenase formation protein HypD [Desulfovibrio sp. ZJ369]|uniref:hydrogenase formation protein HypD n=1 Tax=Desulfovibrio sp. ZJ369 TaxID=2709793 RepID=UPI0013EA5CFB|nr:hydrogenase formation protein HypD [Desulfovibrio sp. ZJ369]